MNANPSENALPPEQPPPVLDYLTPVESSKLIRLRQFSSAIEANLALLKLQSEGILAQLVGEDVQNGLGGYGIVSNGVDLMVLETDAQDALGVLARIDARIAARHAAEAAARKCPRCGQDQSLPIRCGRMSIAAYLLALLLAIGASLSWNPSTRRTCKKCGYRWIPRSDHDVGPDREQADENQ